MSSIELKYGLNPHQPFAQVRSDREPGPLEVVNGKPSFINILDALRGWQLVRDLRVATGKPAATSFKHVSPAGAGVAGPLSEAFGKAFFFDELDLSPLATAYAKARSSDRPASFGDFIAVSDEVDVSLARLIKPEVSDGIIAPGYEPKALEILRSKKGGAYVMLKMDRDFQPPATETRSEFGLTLEQTANTAAIDRSLLANAVTRQRAIPDDVAETLLVITATLKHTQSNSVAVGHGGQAVGIGAGQQSRIACTRLACDKFDAWLLKQHPKALSLKLPADMPRPEKVNVLDQYVRWHTLFPEEQAALHNLLGGAFEPISFTERAQWLAEFPGIGLSSDAFFPFRDNLDRAARSAVGYVVQAGGSKRDEDVIAAADEHGMVMVMTGLRLFLH